MKLYGSLGLLFLIASCGQQAEPPPAVQGGQDSAATTTISGKKIYDEFCFSCHAAGLSGAPKLGDVEEWAPRIAKGRALLLEATIEGIPPAMPPRGICMSCSDEELAAAVDYMIEQSQ